MDLQRKRKTPDNEINRCKNSTYTQETLVIENPAKELLDFVNQLRDRKLSQ